jgi:hypothetical protein
VFADIAQWLANHGTAATAAFKRSMLPGASAGRPHWTRHGGLASCAQLSAELVARPLSKLRTRTDNDAIEPGLHDLRPQSARVGCATWLRCGSRRPVRAR